VAQNNYNLDLDLSTRVTAAAANTTALRSFTLATDVVRQYIFLGRVLKFYLLKMTLLSSFHISVMTVSPGYTTPANLYHSLSSLVAELHPMKEIHTEL